MNLKERLLEIRANEWRIPGNTDLHELALEAMGQIGTTDSEFRDELILELLWSLITDGKLTRDTLRELLDVSLSEQHLFSGLGLTGDDSVFNRAFTILVVRCIIYYHNHFGGDFLTETEMDDVFNKVIDYVKHEKDVRGYVQDKGWGHAAAHSADALRTLALCSLIKHDQLLEILEVVREKTIISDYTYINEEDERLASAVMNVIGRGLLSDREIIEWIQSFKEMGKPDKQPELHAWRENVKNMLRSLYFRLKYKKGSPAYMNEIEQVIYDIDSIFYTRVLD